jgi:hypothetical protein
MMASSTEKSDANEKSLAAIEIEQLSFVVRSQKFKITATVMKRTAMPLATEYAVRSASYARYRSRRARGFFGFGASETQVLVQAGDPLVTERDGKFSLSTKGREAVSPMSDDIKLFEVDEINAIQCFDLIAFAPVDDADLNAARLRAPQFGGAIVIDLQLLTRAFAVNDRWVKTRR